MTTCSMPHHSWCNTDSNPLTYVFISVKLNALGHRLADYNFTIQYCPGKSNTDADGLSRRPSDMGSYMEECNDEVCQDVISASLEGVALERESPCQEAGGVP